MTAGEALADATGRAELDDGVRRTLLRVGTANVANALLARGFRNVMMQGVSSLADGQEKLVGPAYTLRFIPAREDLDDMENYARDDNLHRLAIEQCPSGAVLVIDAFGSSDAASMGDLMAERLRFRGVAGVVTDGGFRDTEGIRATGLPAYQRSTAAPATPIRMHPIAVDEPIGCAGVAIYPGDVLVGDGDGIVVIPGHLTPEVAEAALAAVEYEEFASAEIRRGRSILGLFPATQDSRREYERWVAAGRPGTKGPTE